jgi:hypothetical protein
LCITGFVVIPGLAVHIPETIHPVKLLVLQAIILFVTFRMLLIEGFAGNKVQNRVALILGLEECFIGQGVIIHRPTLQ